MTQSPETIATLHFLHALFRDVIGHDVFFAEQIQLALRMAGTEASDVQDQPSVYCEHALRLYQKLFEERGKQGFAYVNAADTMTHPGPLWLRERILQELSLRSGLSEVILVIGHLPRLYGRTGRSWNPTKRRRYEEAVFAIRSWVASATPAHQNLTLLVL